MPASPHPAPYTPHPHPRGGRRPGAGAPRGNLNAMKSGAYSRQACPERSRRIKALQIALRTMPLTADVLRRADAAGEGKRGLLARVLHHYADLILLNPEAIQSNFSPKNGHLQIRPRAKKRKTNRQSTAVPSAPAKPAT